MYAMLVYDIPEGRGNPSTQLRPYGQRINLSVWIVPAGGIPDHIVDWIQARGGDVHIIPFEDRSDDKVRAMATAAMARELGDLTARMEAVVDDAARIVALDEVGDEAKAVAGHRRKAWLRRAKRDIAAAEAAMVVLNLAPSAQRAVGAARAAVVARMNAEMANGKAT